MNKHIYELLMAYHRQEISVIPCKKGVDKYGNETGKIPAISDWSQFCDRLPTESEIREWASIPGVNGFGIVAGKASNIACIDIDTEDQYLIDSLMQIIPETPVCITGNPKRGGKFIYRLYDEIEEYEEPQRKKIAIKNKINPKKTDVDIFYGNAYLCAPPSFHSTGQFYQWRNKDLYLVNFNQAGEIVQGIYKDQLPILDDPYIADKISMCVRGMTPHEMSANLPKTEVPTQPEGNFSMGRWQSLTTLCSRLIKQKRSMDDAVSELLKYDRENHADNLYFTDQTKGCNLPTPELNAINFYCGHLKFINNKKPIDEVEQPIFKTDESWDAPLEIYGDMQVPKFDTKWIPHAKLREMIEVGSEVTAISPQCLFFYFLGGLSAAIGNKLMIQPYNLNKEYVEPCNLYVGIVASSGERKSETTRLALKPLLALEKKLKKENGKKIAEEKQKLNDIEIRIKQLNKIREKEIREQGLESEELNRIMDEIHKLEMEKPEVQSVHLYEQRATVEKLYEIAETNQTGFFIEFNEWGPKYHQLQLKESSNERSFLLDAWDGKKSFSYKTKHQGSNYIEKLCAAVGFSCQSDVMKSIIWRVQHVKRESEGLMQRFLLICSDNIKRPVVDKQYSIPHEVYNLVENAYYIDENEPPISMERDAYEKWVLFQEEIADKKMKESDAALRSALSKYTGLIIRMAGLMAVIMNDGSRPGYISNEAFNYALLMMQFCEENLNYLFKETEKEKYEEIIALMKVNAIYDEMSVRNLYKEHPRYFGYSPKDAMKIVQKLEAANIVQVYKEYKSTKIRINPSIANNSNS